MARTCGPRADLAPGRAEKRSVFRRPLSRSTWPNALRFSALRLRQRREGEGRAPVARVALLVAEQRRGRQRLREARRYERDSAGPLVQLDAPAEPARLVRRQRLAANMIDRKLVQVARLRIAGGAIEADRELRGVVEHQERRCDQELPAAPVRR